MEDLGLEEIVEILDVYDIKYASLSGQGDVNLRSRVLRINPVYNDDVGTLLHEFAHIYYESILGVSQVEEFIEYVSQQYIIDNPLSLDYFNRYLESRTERVHY